MADTGLTFSADGSGDYIKVIRQVESVQKRLDKALKATAKSSDKFTDSLLNQGKAVTSTSRRLNTLIDRLGQLDVEIKNITGRLPKLFSNIEKGFSSGSLGRKFQELGSEIGDSFIDGIEESLGIRSPSRVMMRVGKQVVDGFLKTAGGKKFKEVGEKTAKGFVSGFGTVKRGLRTAMDNAVRVVRSGIQTIQRELDSAGRSMKDFGSGLMSGGANLLAAGGIVGALTAGGAGVAVNQFATFEDSLINAQSILGATNDEMALLQDQLLAIGGGSTAGAFKAADSFYAIVSGVQDATIHMDILNASIATSEAGQAELTATTSGLISVMNSYGGEVITAGRAGDVFSRTVQMGVGTMDGFVSAMSPVAGLAATMGISFEEMGSSMAFMTARGATTGAAATRLQGIMVAMLRPNEDMIVALRDAGFESGQVAVQQLGLVGAIQAVNDALGNDAGAMASALGRVEAMQGAITLLDENYSQFSDNFNQGLEGATADAREIQLQRTNAAIDMMRSSLGALTIEIGQHLAPVVATFANGIASIATRIRTFMQNNQELASILTKTAVAVGFVVAGLLSLAGIVAIVAGASAFLSGSVMLGFAGALGAVASIIFSPVGIIAGLVAVVGYFTILPGIMAAVGSAMQGVSNIISRIRSGISAVTGANIGTNEQAIARENELLERRQDILNEMIDINDGLEQSQSVQIEQGDTLWDLSLQYGVSVQDILDANEGLDPRMLSIGQTIEIPVEVDFSDAQDDLMILRGQLTGVDAELNALDAPSSLSEMSTDFADLAVNARSVVDGLISMASGDVTGGLESVRTGISGIGTSISGIWDTFVTGFMGDEEDNPIVTGIETMIANVASVDFTALSGGNPIVSAIETMFDNAVTNLDLSQSVTDFTTKITDTATALKDGFTGAIANIFTGTESETVRGDFGEIIEIPAMNPLETIIGWLNPFVTSVSAIQDTVADVLPGIISGIGGFITGLTETIDFEQLGEAGGNIAGGLLSGLTLLGVGLTNLLAPFIDIANIGGAAIITGVTDALPALGETLAHLINTISALLTGDVGTAFLSFVAGIVSFGEAIASFVVGSAEGVITAIENIAGIELPDFETAMTAWAFAFDNGWLALQLVINSIKAGIETFILDMRIKLAEFTSISRDLTLATTFGAVDIAPNIEFRLAELNTEALLREQLALGDSEGARQTVDMAMSLGLDVEQITMSYQGTEGFTGLQDIIALEMATASGEEDTETMEMLIPLAVSVGLTSDDVLITANEAGIEVGDEMTIGLNESLGIASPSQVAIDAGMAVTDGLALGMTLNMFKMLTPINMIIGALGRIVSATIAMAQVMSPVQARIAADFDHIANSAKGLWTFLFSIKIMMEEIGLSPGEAVAAASQGTGGADAIIAEFGGGKAEGGDISATRFYEINEGGIPEVGEIGGRTYLFPGGDGFISPVTSAPDVMGTQSVSNTTSSQSSVTTIGSITVVIPETVDNPQSMQDWFLDMMDDLQESTTVNENLRDDM